MLMCMNMQNYHMRVELLDLRDLDELDLLNFFILFYDITHCHIIQSQSYHLLNSNDFLNKDHPIDHKRTYSLFALQQHLRSQKI